MTSSPDEPAAAGQTWAVWRMDDNGNRFLVQHRLATREEAERLVAEFTARGHKQVYWVEAERGARRLDD